MTVICKDVSSNSRPANIHRQRRPTELSWDARGNLCGKQAPDTMNAQPSLVGHHPLKHDDHASSTAESIEGRPYDSATFARAGVNQGPRSGLTIRDTVKEWPLFRRARKPLALPVLQGVRQSRC